MQLVTPRSPFVSPEAVVGMAVYSAKASYTARAATLGNDGREHPLIEGGVARPVFHKENDNV